MGRRKKIFLLAIVVLAIQFVLTGVQIANSRLITPNGGWRYRSSPGTVNVYSTYKDLRAVQWDEQ
jgi:hypothetical protein